MGLSEEDKKRIPYFREMQIKEEKERWEEATRSPEYKEISEKIRFAFEDHLHQRIMANFKAKDIKIPTVGEVVRDADFFTKMICEDLVRVRPYLTEKMLERFDLVKKENRVQKNK